MYGGIEDPKELKEGQKITPSGDVYSMKVSQSTLIFCTLFISLNTFFFKSRSENFETVCALIYFKVHILTINFRGMPLGEREASRR